MSVDQARQHDREGGDQLHQQPRLLALDSAPQVARHGVHGLSHTGLKMFTFLAQNHTRIILTSENLSFLQLNYCNVNDICVVFLSCCDFMKSSRQTDMPNLVRSTLSSILQGTCSNINMLICFGLDQLHAVLNCRDISLHTCLSCLQLRCHTVTATLCCLQNSFGKKDEDLLINVRPKIVQPQ